jgi:hypothetical protein
MTAGEGGILITNDLTSPKSSIDRKPGPTHWRRMNSEHVNGTNARLTGFRPHFFSINSNGCRNK